MKNMFLILIVATVAVSIISCATNHDELSQEAKIVARDRPVPGTEESTQFIRESGIFELRFTTQDWRRYEENYKSIVAKNETNPSIKQYKQRVLNMIVNESDWQQSTEVTQVDALYLAKEFNNLETAYPKANFLVLERLLSLSSQGYGESTEFQMLVLNASQKGIQSMPKASSIMLDSGNNDESYIQVYKENYEVFLPRYQSLLSSR